MMKCCPFTGYALLLSFVVLLTPIISEQTECLPVHECGSDVPQSLGGLSYELDTSSWNGELNSVCPNTDPTIPNWEVKFDPPPLNGTYCSHDSSFDSSDICVRDGSLIFFELSGFRNRRDILSFYFNSSTFNTILTIRYANTSIFPKQDIMYFNEGQSFVQLNYFIYSTFALANVDIYHNGELLSDPSLFPDVTTCVSSISAVSTTILRLTITDPVISSAGEYRLELPGFSPAVITLVANFTISPVSSSIVVVSPSLSPVITNSSFSKTTVYFSTSDGNSITTSSTPSNTNTNQSSVFIITGVSLVILILLWIIAILIVAVLIYMICFRKRKEGFISELTEQLDKEKINSVNDETSFNNLSMETEHEKTDGDVSISKNRQGTTSSLPVGLQSQASVEAESKKLSPSEISAIRKLLEKEEKTLPTKTKDSWLKITAEDLQAVRKDRCSSDSRITKDETHGGQELSWLTKRLDELTQIIQEMRKEHSQASHERSVIIEQNQEELEITRQIVEYLESSAITEQVSNDNPTSNQSTPTNRNNGHLPHANQTATDTTDKSKLEVNDHEHSNIDILLAKDIDHNNNYMTSPPSTRRPTKKF